MLEMLLPAQIRTQYPRYAPIIPLIDKESDNDSQGLTMDQKIESLRVPLLELRRVYLQLCAGRKEKHINYVIRGIIPDICVTVRSPFLLPPVTWSVLRPLRFFVGPLNPILTHLGLSLTLSSLIICYSYWLSSIMPSEKRTSNWMTSWTCLMRNG